MECKNNSLCAQSKLFTLLAFVNVLGVLEPLKEGACRSIAWPSSEINIGGKKKKERNIEHFSSPSTDEVIAI